MTLPMFNDIFGFSNDGLRYIPADFDEHAVWADLNTCTKPFTPRISKATQLKKPALRYLHRIP
ncbi:hypothetical protein Tsubulata_009325 [Turnera subulata]|uniref:Uncharacterized protein n=1 Tax=Turnera subulata TaxID=218843 RepID=A0A9Q0F4V3_9ROSI|nr:hypothetical protein Tsubulata_009325 [Turnera subulata]